MPGVRMSALWRWRLGAADLVRHGARPTTPGLGAIVEPSTPDHLATHYTIRGPNTDVVLVDADDDHFWATDVELRGTAPCGQGTTVATGTFQLVTSINAGPSEPPPTISIDNTSPISCPTSVTPSATASDPDGDLVGSAGTWTTC